MVGPTRPAFYILTATSTMARTVPPWYSCLSNANPLQISRMVTHIRSTLFRMFEQALDCDLRASKP